LVDGPVQVDVIVDGSGPALVLLPSSQRDSEDFDDLAQRLAQSGFKVLRPQPRGMGNSRGPMEGLDLVVLARDVALTVDRLGNGPALLVGHAFGHWVARVADMNHPQQVRAVVLLGAAARSFPPGVAQALAVASDPSQPEADRLTGLQFAFFAPGNDARPWLQGWHPELRAVYRKAGATPPKEQWFGVSNAPVLDLQGADDPWRPASTRNELKDVLGDKVTVQVIAKASHAMVPEQPEAITRAIVQWVRGLIP
jgi:pimeloyl-ACP methyl ester carboxylesterase